MIFLRISDKRKIKKKANKNKKTTNVEIYVYGLPLKAIFTEL
jgi:hypothetical protein